MKHKTKTLSSLLCASIVCLALAKHSNWTFVASPLAPFNSVEVLAQSREETVLPPQLVRIAECESGNRQFDEKGRVIRGMVNHNDVGRYQINLDFHQKEAEAMGLNLLNEKDNETYAVYLYVHQGTKPWAWSSKCWK